MDTQAQLTRWLQDTGPGTHSQSLQPLDVALFHSEPHRRGALQEPEREICGGGHGRNVTFRSPYYKIQTTIPTEYFPGRHSINPLEDLSDEIYRHTGVRDDLQRDQLVKSISGVPHLFFPFHYRFANGVELVA
ncbi:hypothetical protein AJ79_10251 [Helicocarpus griseus UAMH5409]|uniref:Uncharacterized protein n=1 Tax=Helicocarpus griseus UAMH5409 TaxID=1447875 RepID=A0A2B7W6H9_9EURO|nr:hypothetical protein AJ79_10251 [Helicocarpus griseus UAMH5409]